VTCTPKPLVTTSAIPVGTTPGGARRIGIAALAFLLGAAQMACSASERTPSNAAATANGALATSVAATALSNGDVSAAIPQPGATRVIGKHDRTIADGKRVCDVNFVYADRKAENIFWAEPCVAVTATMIDRQALEASDRWTRLDAFEQKFVESMPGGQVLQIEGTFSASIYPIDTTGTSIEVSVAD